MVYVGEEARIACTHKIIYRSHVYLKLYSWAPRGMPINSEQLWLLVQLVLEGGLAIQMQEQFHAALLLREFHRISFFTHESCRDRTMHCVQKRPHLYADVADNFDQESLPFKALNNYTFPLYRLHLEPDQVQNLEETEVIWHLIVS